MKWFWYSLIVFCILTCSCKTQKSAHLINEASKETVHTEWSKFKILADSCSIYKFDIDYSKLMITETLKITEYDKESGKPIKETDAKREIAQDTDKVIAEEVQKREELSLKDSLNHFRDLTQKMESEVKEETKSDMSAFWEQLGKFLGIILGGALAIKIFLRPLKNKFGVS